MNPFLVSRNIGGLSVKPPARAWARLGFLCGWAGSGQNQPNTVPHFLFFFFCPALEICRKLQKNPKNMRPIFLAFLFSLEFNKNNFMNFRGNKEF
jgi:hypothetical protein